MQFVLHRYGNNLIISKSWYLNITKQNYDVKWEPLTACRIEDKYNIYGVILLRTAV